MVVSKNKKKLKKSAYLLKNKWRHFLQRTEKTLLREMKEQDLRIFWDYLGSFKIEKNYEEESKIYLYVVSIFLLATLIMSGNFIFTNEFHIHFKMTNAQASENIDLKMPENDKLSADVEVVNEYKLKSSEEICTEVKNQKQSSGLCGKDDEEELQKIEKERLQKIQRSIASRPRVLKISCGEDDLGDPSKSETKGKHMDEDCCPDPDEWAKPGCVYNAKGYSIMLSGQAKSKK